MSLLCREFAEFGVNWIDLNSVHGFKYADLILTEHCTFTLIT